MKGKLATILVVLGVVLLGAYLSPNANSSATPSDEPDSQAFTLEANKNPNSSVKVRLKSDKTTARPGDEITLTLASDTDGFLYLLYLSESGKVRRLWPNEDSGQLNRVYANKPIRVPGPGADFKIVTDGSSGAENIIALVTARQGALLRDSDFQKRDTSQPGCFMGDVEKFVEEFAQRTRALPSSEKWGIAEILVPVGTSDELGEDVAAPPTDGSARVTLHVYSGRPDPTWTVPREKAMELARIVGSSATKSLKSMPENDGLGYRGITVQGLPGNLTKGFMHFFDSSVNIDGLEAKGLDLPAGQVEKWLLESAGDTTDLELKQYVEQEILKPKLLQQVSEQVSDTRELVPDVEIKAFRLMAPPYNPGKWNSNRYICSRNNCYNYGNDRPTNTFAQPGRRCGQLLRRPISCASVTRAAICDGLEQLSPGMVPREEGLTEKARENERSGGHALALVIWPGRDFHWYRRDSNGFWSHKPGTTPARDLDSGGRKINDIRRADHGPYKFCGFFLSHPSKTRIK